MEENGTLVPSEPASEVPASAGVPEDSEIHHTYQYDSHGNWTEQTMRESSGSHESSGIRQRKLTCY